MQKDEIKNVQPHDGNALLTAVPLPCPFCGAEPRMSKEYWPAEVFINCVAMDCFVRPGVSEVVHCEPNSDGKTFSPQFEDAYLKVIQKWNTRHRHSS